MAQRLKTHETSWLLALGEKLRENPGTILLSVPVFLTGVVWFSLGGNKRNLSGSWGHLGLVFKNYYRHYFKAKFLLKLAVRCLAVSAKHALLKDKPAVLVAWSAVLVELGMAETSEKILTRGVKLALKLKDYPQAGHLLSHRGRLFVGQEKVALAQRDFKKALGYLEAGIKKKKDSLYYHIWLSGLELNLADFYFGLGKKKEALRWAKRAEKGVREFGLQTRKLDVEKLMRKMKVS